MVSIYTGYFDCLDKYLFANLAPVSICGRAPDWYIGRQMKKFAPRLWFYEKYKNKVITASDYVIFYRNEVLSRFSMKDVFEEFKGVAQAFKASGIVLLCYEKPEEFCHRHLLANALNEFKEEEFVTEFHC